MSDIIHPQFANHPSIQLLEGTLAAARAGRISAIGIVSVSPLGQYSVAAAGSGEQVYVACDVLKANLIAQIADPRRMQMPTAGSA